MDKPATATESTSRHRGTDSKYTTDIQDEDLREKIENCSRKIIYLDPRKGDFLYSDTIFDVLLTDGGVVLCEIDKAKYSDATKMIQIAPATLAAPVNPSGSVDIFALFPYAKYVMLHQDFLKENHLHSKIRLAYGEQSIKNIYFEIKRMRQGKLLHRQKKESSPSAAPEAERTLLMPSPPQSKETSPQPNYKVLEMSPRSLLEMSPRSLLGISPQSLLETSPRLGGETSTRSLLKISPQLLGISPRSQLEPPASPRLSPQSLVKTSPRSGETSPVKTSPRLGETSPRLQLETSPRLEETSPQSSVRIYVPRVGDRSQQEISPEKEASPQPEIPQSWLEPTSQVPRSRKYVRSKEQSATRQLNIPPPPSKEPIHHAASTTAGDGSKPGTAGKYSSRMKLPPITPPPGVPEVTSVQFSSKPPLPNIPLSKPAGVDESDEDIAVTRPPNRESPLKFQHKVQPRLVPTELTSDDEPVDENIEVKLEHLGLV